MQTALLTYVASNCSETSAEAVSSGQGLRVSSALRSQKTDTLFTKILEQGIAVNVPIILGGDAAQVISTDDGNGSDQDAAADVCSLLAQMMVMQSSGQPDGTEIADGKNVNGILSVINEVGTAADSELKGLEHAASVILQNNGKAAEVLSAKAAARSAADMNEGPANSKAAGKPFETVLSGIAEAMKNELTRNKTAVGAEALGTTENTAAAAGTVVSSELQNIVISTGLKENRPATANNDGSKTAVLPEELSMASSGTASATQNKAAAGPAASGSNSNNNDPGTSQDESSFGGHISRDKNKTNEAGTAANGANQMQRGAEIKGETMAEKTASIERALNSFTNDLRSLRSGNQEIRIVLEPESLGVLIISVLKTDSGISAKIKSEDKEVVAIISDQLQKLVSSMQNKGIKVNDVDVVYSQTEQNTNFTQQGFSQARDESSRGYKPSADSTREAEASMNDVWQNFYSGETDSDAMVDYRV